MTLTFVHQFFEFFPHSHHFRLFILLDYIKTLTKVNSSSDQLDLIAQKFPWGFLLRFPASFLIGQNEPPPNAERAPCTVFGDFIWKGYIRLLLIPHPSSCPCCYLLNNSITLLFSSLSQLTSFYTPMLPSSYHSSYSSYFFQSIIHLVLIPHSLLQW